MDLFDLAAKITLDTTNFEHGVSGASDKWEKFASGISSAASKINSIGEMAFKAFSGAASAAATGIGAFAKYVVDAGSNFEAQMSKVAAISGATGESLDALNEKAKEMGAKTKFSATEAGEAFEYMAMAGWKTEQMLGGIEGIMNLAAASGEELGTVSDIVTDALTAFGLKAEDAGHFADVLAAASSNANTNVGMMGETFKYAAPVAGALGFSIEDTAAAIGLMANAGIKGSQAGTALRSMFSRLAKPTKEVQTAMDALGISLTDEQGNVKDLGTIMEDLRAGFADCTDAEAAQYAAMIAGQEAMSGLLAIISASEDDFGKLTSAIKSADGTALDMAETMQNNLTGAITILKSSLESFALAVYSDAKSPLTDFVSYAQQSVVDLTAAYQSGGFGGAIQKAGEIFGETLSKGIELAPSVLKAGSGLVNKIIGTFTKTLVSKKKSIQGAIKQFGNTLSDGFKTAVDAGTTIIKNFGGDIAEQFLSFKGDIFNAGVDIITSLAEGIGKNSDGIAKAAVGTVTSIADNIITGLPTVVESGKQLVTSLAHSIGDWLSNPDENGNTGFDKIKAGGEKVISFVADGAKEAWELLKDGASWAIGKVGDWLSNPDENGNTGFDKIKAGGEKVISFIADGAKGAWELLKDGVSWAVNSSLDWLITEDKDGKTGVQKIKDGGEKVISFIADGIKGAWETAKDALQWALEESADFLSKEDENGTTVKEKFKKLGAELVGDVEEGVTSEKFHGLGGKFIDDIEESIDKNTKEKKKSIFAKISEFFFGAAADIESGKVAEANKSAIDRIFDWGAEVNEKMRAFFSKTGEKNAEKGQQIIDWGKETNREMWEFFSRVGEKNAERGPQMLDAFEDAMVDLGDAVYTFVRFIVDSFGQFLLDVGHILKKGWDTLIVNTSKWLFGNDSGIDPAIVDESGASAYMSTRPQYSSANNPEKKPFDYPVSFPTARVPYSESANGKQTSSIINGMAAASSGGGTAVINLNVDGEKVASVVYDPLNRLLTQRDVSLRY